MQSSMKEHILRPSDTIKIKTVESKFGGAEFAILEQATKSIPEAKKKCANLNIRIFLS
jgi:hypothetical protein